MLRYMMGCFMLWGLMQDADAESPCWCEYLVQASISPELDCVRWFPFEGGCAEEPEGPEDWNARLRNQCDSPVIIDCTEYSMDCMQGSEPCEFVLSFPDRVENMAGNSMQIEAGEQVVWAFNIPNPRSESVYSEYSCTIVNNDSSYALELSGSFWCDFTQSGGCEYGEDTGYTEEVEDTESAGNESSTEYNADSRQPEATNNKAPKTGCSVSSQSATHWNFAWLFWLIGAMGWCFQRRKGLDIATKDKRSSR